MLIDMKQILPILLALTLLGCTGTNSVPNSPTQTEQTETASQSFTFQYKTMLDSSNPFAAKVQKLLDDLEESDDVQDVFHNADLPDEE